MTERELIDLSYALLREYHADQVDKSGEPYWFHPERVGIAVAYISVECQAAGYLHDIVEDTPMTLEKLRELGVPEAVVVAVDYLTRREGEKYWDYIERVKGNEIARAVKLADLTDNMRPGAPESLYERYRKSVVQLGS